MCCGVYYLARLIRDPETQRPKGFGFITFESEDDARKAMKSLDGKVRNPIEFLH